MQDDQKIITIKEMRKSLGKEYELLPDSEIEAVINGIELMAEIAIKEIKATVVPKSP